MAERVLWTIDELMAAAGGSLRGQVVVSLTGVSIDSRSVAKGDIFAAIKGDRVDGHDYAAAALGSGAGLAIVSRPTEAMAAAGPLLIVDDVLKALEKMGLAARARCKARIIAVTGSVGKTSTKEMLRLALSASGYTHASVASFNNHWGVPLTLARMPADTAFAVFEIGMNHAGEITPLVRMVRPHIALITTVAASHLGHFTSVAEIADAKAEIFNGLEPDGIAIVPNDTPHRDRLVKAARRHADRIVTFGGGDADVHAIHAVAAEGGGSLISACLLERELTFTISQRGEHWVSNALAVLAAVEAVDEDVAVAGLALADLGGLKGRGERHIIPVDGGDVLLVDESYNANPASMAATLKSLGAEKDVQRRIAVLGPMRELGPHSDALHAAMAPWVLDAHVDELILIGDEMRPLAEQVVGRLSLDLVGTVDEACRALLVKLRPGDAVLVKASNSVGLAKLVEHMVRQPECST